MIHRLFHLLRLNRTIYQNWWVETTQGKKLMGGRRCKHCGELTDIHPTSFEITFDNK